jgi:endonuclease V-like protein UPF0215 family
MDFAAARGLYRRSGIAKSSIKEVIFRQKIAHPAPKVLRSTQPIAAGLNNFRYYYNYRQYFSQ